jgi:hypothetical protein
MNEFPRMLYKVGGTVEIDRANFSTMIINDEDELEAAQAEGWALTPGEAKDLDAAATAAVKTDFIARPDDAATPLTRDEMKAKAAELGLTYPHNISNVKLAELLEAAQAEG